MTKDMFESISCGFKRQRPKGKGKWFTKYSLTNCWQHSSKEITTKNEYLKE